MSSINNKPGEGGSGNAENKGDSREDQKAQHVTVSDNQKQDIAAQTDLDPNLIGSVEETGALSGRDDAAGGSGDEISGTSSNQGTDRF
ncbi:MAG TPA: hypothetical protein VF623_08230 [Segetibacter sp.]|jgi:hypothetical protein